MPCLHIFDTAAVVVTAAAVVTAEVSNKIFSNSAFVEVKPRYDVSWKPEKTPHSPLPFTYPLSGKYCGIKLKAIAFFESKGAFYHRKLLKMA